MILKMLQCWESKREFYIGGSTLLCQFIESVTFAHYVCALCNDVTVLSQLRLCIVHGPHRTRLTYDIYDSVTIDCIRWLASLAIKRAFIYNFIIMSTAMHLIISL